jgi:hypothetical protein
MDNPPSGSMYRLAPLQDECNQLLAILTAISKKVKSYAR